MEVGEMEVGDYEPQTYKKGFNETYLETRYKIKDGDVFWIIRVDKEGYFDVKTQFEAEVISRLVRIENMLNELKVNK
jgi:hypothetical protein